MRLVSSIIDLTRSVQDPHRVSLKSYITEIIMRIPSRYVCSEKPPRKLNGL